MHLTKFTDYSLRVAIYLALHPNRLVTIADIAQDYDIPTSHLMKIVHRMAQRGYIETVRGKGGGMRLARTPDMINIGDLVRDTEDNLDIAECFDPKRQNCPMLPACALRSVLVEARKNFLATLDSYRLSDIQGKKTAASTAMPLYKKNKPLAAPASRKRPDKVTL